MSTPLVPIFDVGDYEAQIERAADAINKGGVIILPTETVYGAAALLNNQEALTKLRTLPPPAQPKPLVIHLAKRDDALRYLGPVNDLAQRMMRKLWPGPVALIFEVDEKRQQDAAASLGVLKSEIYDGPTITLRCPDHIVAIDVLSQCTGPVVIRRAEAGSDPQHHDLSRITTDWGDNISIILDAGPTRYSKPSTIVKILPDRYEIIRPGVYDQRIIERLLRTTLLFVCSGNTCRSPMAEAIARKLLSQKLNVTEDDLDKKGVSVLSAGSFAMPGARATPAAVQALKDIGADLSRHRSRPLSVELIHQADMIYAMGRGHAQAVLALVPSATDKVTTLDPEGDIEDPIGGDVSLYHTLAGQLQTLIEKRLAERSIP